MLKKAFVLVVVWAAAAIPGWAVLGGSAESVAADQLRLQAKRSVVETQGCTLHVISLGDGTLIREYVAHRRTAAVHDSDLVVENSGHMRAFDGRAYFNSMLPSGVGQDIVK